MIKNGFTLVEAIVAIGIITIGLVGVLRVFPVGFSAEKASQMETQAVMAAQEKIEELSAKSFSDLSIGTITEDSLAAPYQRFSRVSAVYYVDANLNETGIPTGLKKIEITVSWRSPLKVETKQAKLISLAAER